MKVILATRNPGKLRELKELLYVPGIELIPVSNWDIDDPEETGSTFSENAILKARYAAENIGLPAIADDSGMELQALNGYPGIYSARCAGENASDEEKRQHILNKMKDIKDRHVRFVCCMAFIDPQHMVPSFFQGQCDGELLMAAKGEADTNIQYDSLFYFSRFKKTFAEMSKEQKSQVSHRGNACRAMKAYLEFLVKNED